MAAFSLRVVLDGREVEQEEHARHMAEVVAREVSELEEVHSVRLEPSIDASYSDGEVRGR